jgi:hypothetical protein
MASPTLSDPITLNDVRINQTITKTSAGVYVLDKTSTGPFVASYVGRSDGDLNKRLQNWVGKYNYFKAAYCSSPKVAFEAECNLYHDLTPPDNSVHPARPSGSNWECPRCTIFD